MIGCVIVLFRLPISPKGSLIHLSKSLIWV